MFSMVDLRVFLQLQSWEMSVNESAFLDWKQKVQTLYPKSEWKQKIPFSTVLNFA